MSNADQETREWRFYIQDMIEFGEKVLSYTEGMDQATFVADSLRYDATLRNLKLIGEVATHIPSDVHTAYPKIQWHRIRSPIQVAYERRNQRETNEDDH